MAAGIVNDINSTSRSFYMLKDITELLGISRSIAYEMIRTMRKECIASGKLTKAYPSGRIPKKYFNEHCMIE